MLDDRMRTMLEEANTLTGEDLEFLRSDGAVERAPQEPRTCKKGSRRSSKRSTQEESTPAAEVLTQPNATIDTRAARPSVAVSSPSAQTRVAVPAASSRGEYERSRTRESKLSTACLGEERIKHDWWPLGTDLVGQIGSEFFTATVVENSNVKSGRSLQIRSGPACGKVCITPSRAAIEATEAHRQAHNLGRGGGVTNGWLFWQPRTGATV